MRLQQPTDGFISVHVPLRRKGELSGLLQLRFPLAGLRQRIFSTQQLILLYVVLYGAILIGFGLYLLGRNVIRPIARLRELTRTIAAGNLEVSLDVDGPREIADLSDSFNRMIDSLRQSREETQRSIASLQQANNELIRSEKMASVGHLAAGMAHELGNPLGAVVGYLELLKVEQLGAHQQDLVERCLVETGRIDRLVRELLDFAAPTPCINDVFDPVPVAEEALLLLSNQGMFDSRQLENHLPATLPAVTMVRHRLHQVLVNLLLNARDATDAEGRIRLFGGVEQGRPFLAVEDGGSGISPEVLPHLFDPFYTTKAPGKGRGLGLAICQRIMEEAGGNMEVHSQVGQGSEFRLWFRAMENS
ncbi:MAG: HAMP domain-containing sensor histidine kinase [Desulfuromonadaceae bacterium]